MADCLGRNSNIYIIAIIKATNGFGKHSLIIYEAHLAIASIVLFMVSLLTFSSYSFTASLALEVFGQKYLCECERLAVKLKDVKVIYEAT